MSKQSAKMLHILVVDDDPQVCNALNEICSYEGSPIVMAFNGQEGLKLARAQKFDLIFVDWNMPVMDGVEFINHLLKDRAHPKIVLMSGTHKSSDISSLIPNEVQFITKPFNVDTITQILESV